MHSLIIFGGKYLILLSGAIAAFAYWRAPRERLRENLSFAALVLPLSYLGGLLARALWFDPRPFMVSGVAPLIAHAADNGFPSDHMLLAASLAACVGYFDKKLAAAMWAVALLLGLSRVLAGIHHTADIVGSIAIVLAAKWIAHAIMPVLWKHKHNQTNS